MEYLRLDGLPLREAIKRNEFKEFFVDRKELAKRLVQNESDVMLEGFEIQKSSKAAQIFIKKLLNVDADYAKLKLEVANDVNQELTFDAVFLRVNQSAVAKAVARARSKLDFVVSLGARR